MTCAVCIGSIYLLQASWFVAWFALDQRRVAAARDGIFPCCIVRKGWKEERGEQEQEEGLGKKVMAILADVLRKRIAQVRGN